MHHNAAPTPMPTRPPTPVLIERSSPWEILRVFSRLGLTSFGGPVAHLGYFRTEFVERRRWLDDKSYVDLVALCRQAGQTTLDPVALGRVAAHAVATAPLATIQPDYLRRPDVTMSVAKRGGRDPGGHRRRPGRLDDQDPRYARCK